MQLLILQHPREQREVKGTARLLHLALAGSRLLVGPAWPAAPSAQDSPACAEPRRDLLLYPATAGDAALAAPPPLDPAWLAQPQRLRLVVVDGTWRKSRRMLYESPWLQQLPRLALVDPPPSRYRIRRSQDPGQRSTFEAALQALVLLEGDDAAASGQASRFDPLWAVFDAFVAQLAQRARLPAAQPPAQPPTHPPAI